LYWDYYPYALIGTGEVAVEYCDWHDGFGNFVTATAVPWFHQQVAANGGRKFDVRAINISEFSKLTVPHWDLVKLDCEASEFSILEHWPGPIATQISVEFHDYMHREKWGKMYFDGLFNYKLTDYEVVQHEDFAACDNAMGHWDSLLVLKGER
jgi:hypothetical protein